MCLGTCDEERKSHDGITPCRGSSAADCAGTGRPRSPAEPCHGAWLESLTAYCEALADIHTYNNESIHEKLHALAGRMGLRKFPSTS